MSEYKESQDDSALQNQPVRSIKDPIHDYIPLSAFICAFIDTRQFQRLRAIKQLGTSYYVWPGASHNRFEHSIGVAHLARLMVERLKNAQPELGITERDVRCVELAGLCHDLGHGPWSHVWDTHFIPHVLPGISWSHEDASEMMFDDLVLQNGIQIPQDDINFVKDLIKGAPNHCKLKNPPEKSFLFDIVANRRNGIDVDKFDYIVRDEHAISDHGVFPVKRLIDSARVIDGEICYHIKDANQIYELCYTRFSNHKRIYNHKTARAIQYMVVDALKAAEEHMQIASRITDPKKYVYLTDDIMPQIEMTDSPGLAKSRAIFDRVRTRDLYKVVDFKTFSWSCRAALRALLTPQKIVEAARDILQSPDMARSDSQDSDGQLDPAAVEGLTTDHVIVDLYPMHYGMQEKNPMDFIKFYAKHNKHKSAAANPGDFSTLMPNSFGEVLLRIFTKDVRYFGIIQAGYRKVLESLPELPQQHPPTPPSTEAASSPRAISTTPDSPHRSFNKDAMPQGKGGKTRSLTNPSPIKNNSFTKVPKNYVPRSPTQEHRKPRSSDGGKKPPAESSSNLADGAPTMTPGANTSASRGSASVFPSPISPTQDVRRTRRKRGEGEGVSLLGGSVSKKRRG